MAQTLKTTEDSLANCEMLAEQVTEQLNHIAGQETDEPREARAATIQAEELLRQALFLLEEGWA